MASQGNRFLLVYASQTGQAQAISEEIRDRASKRGLQADLHCLSESEKKFHLEKEPVFVVVTSTTGDGDPPDTASKFWRKLKKKTLTADHLGRCRYALLGLGDTNYTNFCNMGKILNRRLLELGATPFHEPGFADDAVGLDIVVEPWIDGLWEPLTRVLKETRSDTRNNSTSQTLDNASADKQKLRGLPDATSEGSRGEGSGLEVESPPKTEAMSSSSSLSLERLLRALSLGLEGKQLTLPSNQPPFISVTLSQPLPGKVPPFPYHQASYGVKSTVAMATIIGTRLLTKPEAMKRTLEVQLSLEDCPTFRYEPGDAFGFVCPNPTLEVEYVLQRLKLDGQGDCLMDLTVTHGNAKKNPILPKHIPIPCSIRQYFTHSADIRCMPKKALLYLLSAFCSEEKEKRRLQEMASRQGAAEYTRLFTELHTDLLDVLHTFPSCQPPLQRLIESLPRLQPRFYSAACSPLVSPHDLKIVFNVVELPERTWLGGRRQGLSSGWFDRVATETRADTLQTHTHTQVPLIPRGLNLFHLPSDPTRHIIMIGPGTGVSPFIGFLQHRQKQRESGVGKSWLFFGCRHPDKDYLYRDQLQGFITDGTLTHLHVSFSRLETHVSGEPRYVQDNMRIHAREVARWVMEENAVVYVCGDAVNMSRDVRAAWLDILSEYMKEKGSDSSAEVVLNQMKEDGRFLQDVWT